MSEAINNPEELAYYQTSLDEGLLIFQLPKKLSAESLEEVKELLAIILRRYERQSAALRKAGGP